MSFLLYEKKWRRQPPQVVEVDWRNPLAAGLRFAVVGGAGLPPDLVSGRLPTIQGAGPYRPTLGPYGFGRFLDVGYLDYGRTGADEIVTGTVFWIANSTNTFPIIFFGSGENAVAGYGFQVGLDNTRLVNNGFYLQGNNADQGNSGFNALTDFRQPEPAAFTWDGAFVRAYSKRALRNSTANTYTAVANSNRITRMAARDQAIDGSVTNAVQLVLAWDRVLPLGEICELTDSPWQLFRPRRIWVPVTAAAGVTGTLTSTAGNDTLASAGSTTILGSLSRTLGTDTLVSSGSTTILGSLSRTLADDTLSSVGSPGTAVAGSLAATLQGATLAASGNLTQVGTLSVTLAGAALASVGTTTVLGSFSTTLADARLNSAGFPGEPPEGSFWRFLGLPLNRLGI